MILHKQNQPPCPQSSQAGFTIIESLIAILVVSILLIGLSPIIVLAIANRIQARRVELGTQAARTYIDGVKTGVIGDVTSGATYQLPTITSTLPSLVPAPTASGTLSCDQTTHLCNSNPNLYCVPGTPPSSNPSPGSSLCSTNSVTDMVVQAYTYQLTPASPPDPTQGYVLGVRVYRADAFKETGTLETAAGNNGVRSQAFTGGLGDRTAPIVEITTDIAGSNTSYSTYCTRLAPEQKALGNAASSCQ